MARTIYYIIKDEETVYEELGQKRVYNDDKKIKNALKKLKSLGVDVQYCEHTKLLSATRTIEEMVQV